MKARLLALTLIFCTLLCALCSCHGARPLSAFSMPDAFDESKQYDITFWAKNDTNKTQTAIYEKAIADFEAIYPNIHVNLRLYTNYGDIYNDVITNIATQTTPNVCITYPDHIATYKTGENTVVSLDALIDHEKYGLGGSAVRFDAPKEDEIVSKFLSECIIDGEIYALPYMRSSEACYVNKTYVEKLGFTLPDALTWDFIWEVSEAAMAKDEEGLFKVNGQKVLIPFIYKSTDNMMITQLAQCGGDYSSENGDILIFNDTTKSLLQTVAEHAGTRAFSTFKISSYPANFLNAGQCIFAIDSTAGATWMGSDAPLCDIAKENIVSFETVVMPLPQFDTEVAPKMISQGPSVCLFNKEDAGEVLASWLFLQYLLTDEVQISYAQTEGYVPVTTQAQENPVYIDYLSRSGEDNDLYYDVKIAASKLLLDHTENTFVTPVFNGSASLRDAAGQLIENVTKSMRRKEVVDDAYYETLFDEVCALYRLDQKGAAVENFGKQDLGPLPTTAVILLFTLAAVWITLILVNSWKKWKNLQKKHQDT